ncbi:hypothetical protein KKF91_00795, partial [Myxococcota bacterium]|nr:hypothetical protein [Myxococcota bacterium]
DIAPLDAARDVIDMFQITLEATPYPPAPTSAPTSAPMIRPSPAPSSMPAPSPAPSSMPAPSPTPSSMPAPSPAPSATLKPGQGQLLGVLFALEPPRPDAEALRDARARALTIYQGCLNGRCALPPPQPVEDPDLEEAAMALDPGQLGWVRAKAGFYVFRALGWSWGFTLEGLRARLDPEIAAQLKAALDEGEGPLDWAILEAAGLLLSVEPFTLDADALPYALRAPLATLPLDAASAPLTLDGADYVLLPSRRALHPAKDRLFAQARLVPFFDSGSGDSAANLSRARLEAARAQLKAGLPFEALVAASADARSRRLGGRLGRVGFEAPLAAMRPGDLRVMAAPEGLWLLYLAPEAAQGASP